MSTEPSISETFEAEQPTFIFILLSIATIGVYYYYWLYLFSKKLNSFNDVIVKFNLKLIFIFIAVSEWCAFLPSFLIDLLEGMDDGYSDSYETLISIIGIFSWIVTLATIVFAIIIAFKLAEQLKMFLGNRKKLPIVASWALVLFQGYYLYYAVRNNSENSKQNTILIKTNDAVASVSVELEKLAKLKNDGLITQDEFETQKAKLLNK